MSSNTKSPVSAKTGGLNSLVHETHLEGTINADSDFRVDGSIKGTLICQSKVIIGPTGKVEGKIQCENAVIEGSFSGELRVSDSLSVKETAKIHGDVFTKKLIVQPDAIFNVVCKMDDASYTTPSYEEEDVSRDILKEIT